MTPPFAFVFYFTLCFGRGLKKRGEGADGLLLEGVEMPTKLPPLLTLTRAAAALEMHPEGVEQLAHDGLLQGLNVNGEYHVTLDSVQAFLAGEGQ